MSSQINVGFFSAKNYLDKTAWSGILYNMYNSLEQKVNWINLGKPKKINSFNKISQRILTKLSKQESTDTNYYRDFSKLVQNQLDKKHCDLIFAPVASQELEFFQTEIPIIYFSDATPQLIKNGYQIYSTEEEYLLACQKEKKVISKASKLIYSSQWAANSAIGDYEAAPHKIEVIPFGANIDNRPDYNEIYHKTNNIKWHLLFIGKEWERKGGIIAFDSLISLLDKGIDAQLLILGCQPPSEIKHEKVKVIKFLDKNIPAQAEEFNQHLLNSNFLILPTRADCSPIVIVEANAYGIPVITTEVGGIPDIITNGKNGYMLPLSAKGEDYAQVISQIISDKDQYKDMVTNSRQEYDDRLNWDKWAEKMYQTFQDTLKNKG